MAEKEIRISEDLWEPPLSEKPALSRWFNAFHYHLTENGKRTHVGARIEAKSILEQSILAVHQDKNPPEDVLMVSKNKLSDTQRALIILGSSVVRQEIGGIELVEGDDTKLPTTERAEP